MINRTSECRESNSYCSTLQENHQYDAYGGANKLQGVQGTIHPLIKVTNEKNFQYENKIIFNLVM